MAKRKYSERSRPKPKSIKTKAKLGSKRKLAKFGKKQKKGHAGTAIDYITRTKAIKRLQITLRDFRRLCILKGIYPREPQNKPAGNSQTYYHVKDIQYLAHEPLLDKFRAFKAFMNRVRKAANRHDLETARRMYAGKPVYTLDHLVKERYPRFDDALNDLDDALSMVHLFAALPSDRTVKASRTSAAKRLSREWQYYVARSHALRKVFLSVKGIYYQAEVHGMAITWLQPWHFSQSLPADVDYRIMLTFMEFHEVLLQFVHFKLYHSLGLQYPPNIRVDVDEMAGNLAAVEARPREASAGTAGAQAAQTDSMYDFVGMEADTDDSELKYLREFQDSEDAKQVLQRAEKMRQFTALFSGLYFFLGREVPRDAFEFMMCSFRGHVGWDGAGSPYDVTDSRVTHQVVDRPSLVNPLAGREYVQPQWVVDSINARMLLPVAKYAPGAVLPPHLSPFVEDATEGYIPAYRQELDRLRAAAAVTGRLADVIPGPAPEGVQAASRVGADADDDVESLDEHDDDDGVAEAVAVAGVKRKGAPSSGPGDASDSSAAEEGDDDEEAEDDDESLEQELAKGSLPAKKKRIDSSGKSSSTPRVNLTKLESERRQLAAAMLTNKQRRMYDRVMAAVGHANAKAETLKRKAVDAAKRGDLGVGVAASGQAVTG